MKPINRKWLPQTITLFNLFKDPDSGKQSYFRTYLEYVRIDQKKRSLTVNTTGKQAMFYTMVFIDPKTSQGSDLNDQGKAVSKEYLDARDWKKLSAEDKTKYWTLQTDDLMVEGECPMEVTPSNRAEFNAEYGPQVLTEIPPVIDKDGSVHHWEVVLD